MAERETVSNKIAALLFSILTLLLALQLLSELGLLFALTNLHKLLIYLVIFILPITVYIKVNRYKRRAALKLNFVKVKYLPFILLYAVSVSIICAFINAGVAAVSGGLWDTRAAASAVGFVSDNPFITMLTMVLMPALCEELLIRGLALYEYEKYGVTASVLMTSAVFSLFHGSLFTIPSLFLAGVFYAVLTRLFNSVYPAVICHIVNNALALYVSTNSDYVGYLTGDTLFLIIAAAALFIILYLTLRLTEKAIDELGGKKRQAGGRRAYGKPLRSVFIWLFFAASLAVSIYNIVK